MLLWVVKSLSCHDITEILLKVALNTIKPNQPIKSLSQSGEEKKVVWRFEIFLEKIFCLISGQYMFYCFNIHPFCLYISFDNLERKKIDWKFHTFQPSNKKIPYDIYNALLYFKKIEMTQLSKYVYWDGNRLFFGWIWALI